jgi:TadE-like protein
MRRVSNAQALVELGVVLPVLLIALIGMVSLGRGLVFGVAVQQGAREAARVGAAAGLDATVTDSVVLDRLIAASAPALLGCAAVLETQQQCGGGSWTFALSVKPPSAGTAFNSLAGARASAPGGIGGWRLEVRARGSVALLVGFDTGALGGAAGQIGMQGDAVVVIL